MFKRAIANAANQPGFGTIDVIPMFMELEEHLLHNFLGHRSTAYQRKRIMQQSRLFGLEQRLKRDFTHARSNRIVDSGSRFQE